PPAPIFTPVLASRPADRVADFWTVSGGHYVLALNRDGHDISIWQLGAEDGTLASMVDSPLDAATSPVAVAVDPGGHYVYIANEGSDNLSVYSIGSDGAISPLTTGISCGVSNNCFPTSWSPSAVAVAPGGNFLFVANEDTNNISVYTIGADGTPTPITAN